VLLEPKRSDAAGWSFVESAGSVFPTIEAESFRAGVEHATGGDAPWTQPLADGVVLAWVLRLDRGMRPLTATQFREWGVTADRVTSAGRSLLFHATRTTGWESAPESPVRTLHVGDGFDAARLFVVEDVFFTDVDSRWRFAIPTPDSLLAVDSDAHLPALVEATRRQYEQADHPLSDAIWRLEKGKPAPTSQ
jgi:hypothetical protein